MTENRQKDFFQNVYSVSFQDMMDIWIESFHPFGCVLVIWDAAKYFQKLRDAGIMVNKVEAYSNKALTIVLPGLIEAYQVMDSVEKEEIKPFMQVYNNGKLVSDNMYF